jgi:hypothetical protein
MTQLARHAADGGLGRVEQSADGIDDKCCEGMNSARKRYRSNRWWRVNGKRVVVVRHTRAEATYR